MNIRRLNSISFLVLLSAVFTFGVSWGNDLPSWISGKPDLNMVKERNALYEWVFLKADEQTNGLASRDDLARKRLINLANKLAVYSKTTEQKEFAVDLRYLVIGTELPMHFSFFITNETLQELLKK